MASVRRTVGLIDTTDNVAILQEQKANSYCFLNEELKSNNYSVEKCFFLRENDDACLVMEHFSKEYDVVIAVGKLSLDQSGLIKALGKVTNQKIVTMEEHNDLEVPSGANILTSSDPKVLPVVYSYNIFLLDENSVEILYLEALKPFLLQITRRETEENEADLELLDQKKALFVYENANRQVKLALKEIEESLQKFGPENVFLSFNGGKDCTVLLHLIYSVLKRKFPEFKKKIFCLYITSLNPFKEQDEFILKCVQEYNLELVTIQSDIKEALAQVLQENPHFEACFMGTRRTDPYSEELHTLQMTDASWPQIMRISPLLDWHYSNIWEYLLYYKVPYCKLYDLGYTSLGNALNTVKNAKLLTNSNTYLPAYKLLDETNERHGRNVKL